MKLSNKIISFILLLGITTEFACAAGATGPNKIYIEQIGNTNLVTIEQIGGTNNVGGTAGSVDVSVTGASTLTATAPSSSNYATITGSSNQVNITQKGDDNSAQYNIKGNNNVYTNSAIGSSNQTKLSVGDITTNGLRNQISKAITGNSNMVIQNIVASDVISTSAITGSSNQITKELKNSNGDSDIAVTGSSNIFNIQQTDVAGISGHYLKQVIAGDFNSFTIQQQGTNDTTVDIKATGDHNTITVRTSNSAIVNPVTAIAR